jgi:hypothetical protein
MRSNHKSKHTDLTGQAFERLMAVRFEKFKNGKTYWFCVCSCGGSIITRADALLSGFTRSCGCLQREALSLGRIATIKHGMADTRLYEIWKGIKKRCLNPNFKGYFNYGGRGITICEKWLDFRGFKEDVYEAYLKHVEEFGERDTTIDRWPNPDGNYESTNFRWATVQEQNLNTRVSAKSENHKEHSYWRSKLIRGLDSIISNDLMSSKTMEPYLGCDVETFFKHMESQFLPGMDWTNHGKGEGKWQTDHVVGCNNFDLSQEKDRYECFNYKNLRPMWDADHKKKSTHRIKKENSNVLI